MSDKRIIELDVTDVVEADDFLAIDSVSGKTRRIKPIRIGATYEIEDGDHSFTLVGSNGYSHTVDIPYDSVSMTQAEYDALTPAQKADGTARFITDGQSDVESELWSKVGRQTLDTEAQVLSNAVNELKGDIDTNTDDISTNTEAISELNSRFVTKTYSATTGTTQYADFYYADITIDSIYGDVASIYIWSVTSNRPAFVVRISAFKFRVFTNVATTTVSLKVRFDKLDT